MSLRGAPAFSRSSLQITRGLLRPDKSIRDGIGKNKCHPRNDMMRFTSFNFMSYAFLTPTLTFSPSNSSSTTDEFSGGVAKDNLDVSVSAVM